MCKRNRKTTKHGACVSPSHQRDNIVFPQNVTSSINRIHPSISLGSFLRALGNPFAISTRTALATAQTQATRVEQAARNVNKDTTQPICRDRDAYAPPQNTQTHTHKKKSNRYWRRCPRIWNVSVVRFVYIVICICTVLYPCALQLHKCTLAHHFTHVARLYILYVYL